MNQEIQIMHGDCLALMSQLPRASVDLILCDLPYGTTQCEWDTVIPLESLWCHWNHVAKENAAMVLFGAEPFSSMLRSSNIKAFKYDWIWHKSQATGHLNCKKQPMREHEVISVFYRKQCNYFPIITRKPRENVRPAPKRKQTDCYGKFGPNTPKTIELDESYPHSILRFPCCNVGESGFHPTQKPVELLKYLISTYSQPGDTVLDSTMGSGSTGVAAIQSGRKFIGMELEHKYFSIAEKRIGESTQQPDMFLAPKREAVSENQEFFL
jgi:DNA modification methylase